ncbi:MAG: HAMP domain-containing protein [Candidatus Aenigmatarchaeota archaeon]
MSFSIKKKLVTGFLLVTVLVGVIAYVSIITIQETLQTSIEGNTEDLAVNVLDKIDRNIYNRIIESRAISKDLDTQDIVMKSNQEFEKLGDIQFYIDEMDSDWTSKPKEEITSFMQEILDNELSNELKEKIEFYEETYGYKLYGEIFVTNKYGANVAQTGKTSDYYQADEEWWQIAKRDGFYMRDVEYDESSDVFSTDIGMRIDDGNGNFIGVAKIVLNIEEIIDIIDMFKPSGIHKNHETMQIELITRDGKIIYATEGHEVLEEIDDQLLSRFFEEDASVKGHEIYYIGYEHGEELLFVHVNSKGYRDYEGLGWILIIKHSTEDVFGPMVNIRNNMVFITLIVLIVAIFSGIFISATISRPITKLKKSVIEIGKGNLDTKIEIRSRDEIGELASAFSQMTVDLKTSRKEIDEYSKNLEKQVVERTKQLEVSKKELESKVDDLERFNKISIGRELRMIELKKKIRELEKRLKGES